MIIYREDGIGTDFPGGQYEAYQAYLQMKEQKDAEIESWKESHEKLRELYEEAGGGLKQLAEDYLKTEQFQEWKQKATVPKFEFPSFDLGLGSLGAGFSGAFIGIGIGVLLVIIFIIILLVAV